MKNRVIRHSILGNISEDNMITFTFNNLRYNAREGETIAAALIANGIRTIRYHEDSGKPRGIYCNIGHCYECRLTVNGKPGVRACLTLVENNMVLNSPGKLDNPLKEWRRQHG